MLDARLLRRVKGARFALSIDVALGFLATVAVLAQAALVAGVVSDAFDGTPVRELFGPVAILIALVAARGALAAGFESVGRRAATGVMSKLRLTLVERRLRDVPDASDGAEAGEVASAAVQGVDALEAYFARYLPQLVLAALVPVAVLAWTATVDPTSVLIMVVTLPVIPVFMALIGRATEARTRARWVALARLSNHFMDVVRGLPTLRAFNRGEAQAERIASVGERYRDTTMQVLRVSFLSGAVLELMATLATALVAVTLGIRLIGGGVTLRSALTVLMLTPELYAPLRALGAQYHASADGLAAVERIFELIGSGGRAAAGAGTPPEAWGEVRLEQVTLAYPGRTGPVLDRFDLRIRRGEVVSLVGRSGSGKTTVAELLLGLRRPDKGTVTVGGVDLAALDLAAWRRQVAWVPQRPTMFRGTVRDNIALGDPDAPAGRVEAAARSAGADEFVRDLRAGYGTRIGDGGRGLSAGEIRRIALARAVLREAPLVILDEPTADLDDESAAVVAAAVRALGRERAVLVIEHRGHLASVADRVVRIEGGAFDEPRAEPQAVQA
jgi:thiol reductant ABC exporter CydD subunit